MIFIGTLFSKESNTSPQRQGELNEKHSVIKRGVASYDLFHIIEVNLQHFVVHSTLLLLIWLVGSPHSVLDVR